MLIVRGVNVFPSQIEHTLLGIDGLTPNYQMVLTTRADRQVELHVRIEPSDRLGVEAASRAGLEAFAREALRSSLGLSVLVELVPPGTIPRSEGKAVRIVDRRSEPASSGT
jgi:phenylacetate-CoA ligase